MNQTNRQSETNQNNKNQQGSGESLLQNKSDNDKMMNSLKSFSSKLEADAIDSDHENSAASEAQGDANAKLGKQMGRGSKDEGRKSLKAVGTQSDSSKHEADSSRKGSSDKAEGLGLDKFKSISFELNKAVDLTKGYFAKDKTAPYLGKLGSEVSEQVVEFVQEWAEKNNAKIEMEVVGVQKETPLYTGIGATAGAGLGYAVGGKVGAALGAIFGAALGTASSCVSVKFGTTEASETQAPVVH